MPDLTPEEAARMAYADDDDLPREPLRVWQRWLLLALYLASAALMLWLITLVWGLIR